SVRKTARWLSSSALQPSHGLEEKVAKSRSRSALSVAGALASRVVASGAASAGPLASAGPASRRLAASRSTRASEEAPASAGAVGPEHAPSKARNTAARGRTPLWNHRSRARARARSAADLGQVRLGDQLLVGPGLELGVEALDRLGDRGKEGVLGDDGGDDAEVAQDLRRVVLQPGEHHDRPALRHAVDELLQGVGAGLID